MPVIISPQLSQQAAHDIDGKWVELRREIGPLGQPLGPVTPLVDRQGNLELIGRMHSLVGDGGDFLVSYVFDSSSAKWNGPTDMVADGQSLVGVTGEPALIQGLFGKQGNFELLVPQGDHLVHYFRDNDAPGFPWRKSPAVVPGYEGQIKGLRPSPVSVSLLQSNFRRPGNLEAVARMRGLAALGGDFLVAYYFDDTTLKWNGPFDITADGQPITGVTGDPALIQGTLGKQGNFELLVPQGDHLAHYFRDNDAPGFPWHKSPAAVPGYPGDIPGLRPSPAAVTLLQSNFGSTGNFEAVVRMHGSAALGGDFLTSYFFDSGARKWRGPFDLLADGQQITGVTGDPALIQSTFGQQGNFELLVPHDDHVVHYFRDNDSAGFPWRKGAAAVPGYPGQIQGLRPAPVAATVIQSNFGEMLHFVRNYEGGRITWTSDSGATPSYSYETQVLYKGLCCFGKQRGPGSDEPYVIASVYSPGSEEGVRTFLFGPHEGVENGTQIPEIKELWRTATTDIVIHTVVMEHDFGPTEEVRQSIQDALKSAADAAAAAAGVAVPPWWVNVASYGLAYAVTEIFGLGDDLIGQDWFLIRTSELKEFWEPDHGPVPIVKFGTIDFNYPRDDKSRPPITDGDASYKAYFEVRTRQVPDF